MSKPRDPWWPYIKNVLRLYPFLKRELDARRSQSVTVRYNKTGEGSGAGRKTEQAALRELDPARQREYDAVQKAIRITAHRPDGHWRNEMIRLVYFRRTHNLYGAAQRCHVAYATAKVWHQEFLREVAKNLSLL